MEAKQQGFLINPNSGDKSSIRLWASILCFCGVAIGIIVVISSFFINIRSVQVTIMNDFFKAGCVLFGAAKAECALKWFSSKNKGE